MLYSEGCHLFRDRVEPLALAEDRLAEALAVAILVCTGFMGDIPYDLDEAAMLDGCGTWGTFFRVIVPLMNIMSAL